MKKLFLLLVFFLMILPNGNLSFAAESKTTIHFAVAVDETASVDRLANSAIQMLDQYDMSVEVFPMAYAIQMANSGEKDALVAQRIGLETEYPNLVMVSEQLSEIHFRVYAKKGFAKKIDDWEDLNGLRVGSLMHKTHIESRLPRDLKEHVFRDNNAELIEALLAEEYDVFVATVSLNDELQIPDSVSLVCELESLPTYIYLNKRYEELAPALSQAISAIKANGDYQRIVDHSKTDELQQKSVLHISSYYADDHWEQQLIDGVTEVLSTDDRIRYENVALNSNRSLNETNRSRAASSMIRAMYLNGPPDVVIASDYAAIQFVMDYYNILFFDVPVILCGQNAEMDDQYWKYAGNGTIIYETIPAEENIELILDIFPDTEQVFILNDHSENGIESRQRIEEQLAEMPEASKLKVMYNEAEPLSEIVKHIGALPENSVVLCGTYSFDSNNKYFTQKELHAELTAGSSLPIFGMRCGSIGYGQVGGKYVQSNLQGKVAAEMALAVLDGKDLREVPSLYETEGLNRWMFDNKVLERFNVPENILPTDSSIIHKQPTLYESNPKAYNLTVLLFVFALMTIIVLSVLFTTIRNKNKRLLSVQKSLHSTEEVLKKDKEIVVMAQRLEIALAVSNSGVWEIDPNTDMFCYDKTIAKALGLIVGACVPIKRMMKALAQSQYGAIDEGCRRALLAGDLEVLNQLDTLDLAFTVPGGKKRYYRSHAKVMKDNNGKIDYVIGLLIDVTSHIEVQQDLTDAKEAAESANRAKSQFLSNMSHEIRTPMNAIIGMADLLATEPLSDKQLKFVRDINASATWLLEIINDLLDLAKIEAGKLELIPVNYSLSELLESLNSMFSYTASQKGLSFGHKWSENLPGFLFGDNIRVRQILVNVISNAVKYTLEGSIEFAVRCDDTYIYYTVTDTGIGIKQKDLPLVFEDYAQFALRRSRNTDGTGLGLAITKRLVEQMRGSIQISSVYGEGTRVDIKLPYTIGSADESAMRNMEPRMLYAPDAKILVVDDKEINLRVASGFLERFGIHCHVARSGTEAIEKIHSTHYDLVFMDQMMPDMDGIEAVRLLRAEGYTADSLKIIAFTANAVLGAKETLLAAGMNDFLPKPIIRSELGDILQKWLPPLLVRFQESDEEETTSLSPLVIEAKKIDGIDTEKGLAIVEGDCGAYQELLRLAMRTIPNGISVMSRCLAERELERLGIEAHGVKSAFHHIGAETLASQALEIELHAQGNDGAFCMEHLAALLDGMQALEQQLQSLFAKFHANDVKPPGDMDSLQRDIITLHSYIDGFEFSAATQILTQLAAFDFGNELNDMILQVADLVDMFDFSAAAILLDEINGTIGGIQP